MASGFPHITISVTGARPDSDIAANLNALSIGFGLLQAWMFTTMFGMPAVFTPEDPLSGMHALTLSSASTVLTSYAISMAVLLMAIGLTNQLLLRFYVGRNVLVAATALASAGSLLLFAVGSLGSSAAIAAGVVMGASASLMLVLWGTAYARYEFTTIIFNAIVSIVLGIIGYLALVNWVRSPFSGILTSLLPIASSLLLWQLTPIPYYRRREIPVFHPLKVRQTAFFLRFGIPVFTFGIALGLLRSISMTKVLSSVSLTEQFVIVLSIILAFGFTLFAASRAREESHWDMIFRMLVPIISLAFVSLPYLSSEYGPLAQLCALCGFACFEALLWIFFSDLSQEFRLSPIYVFGVGRSLLALGSLLSLGLVRFPIVASFVPELVSHEMALLSLLALICAYCLLPRQREMKSLITPMPASADEQAHARLHGVLDEHEEDLEASEAPSKAATHPHVENKGEEKVRKGRFHTKCEEIADRYLLSRRETEVMFLLAKGHNAAYIQDRLCISKSTAKTHINHIYRKLNIHTQQELLNMVDEGNDAVPSQSVFIKPPGEKGGHERQARTHPSTRPEGEITP